MVETCKVENVAIEAGIGEATTLDCGLECATIVLHRKCPQCPDRARGEDAVSDMEEGMYGEGTGGEMLEIVLIVQAGRHPIHRSAKKSR